jgi:hypothetical protein
VSNEFDKLFDTLEKADKRFQELIKLQKRVIELEKYILEQGKKNNVCTYEILNKKVCPDCKCVKQ